MIGAVVALLVVVAIVFAAQSPTEFAPDTPEGTIQGYFQAVNDHDQDLAETFLTDELRSECNGPWWFGDEDESARVVITDTSVEGDSATIKVAITVSYGDDPFGGGSYDNDETMDLVRTGDRWLISEPVWPMDHHACRSQEG